MKAIKTERIVKTYYDALEEGKVLGRKCLACGHIEFPPYLACNECGNLDTEWVDLTDVRAHITQILPPLVVFPETEFKEANGGFMAICVQIENADPYVTSLVHIDADRYQELHDNLENVIVKPYIVQGEDTKICSWVLEDYVEEASQREAAAECVQSEVSAGTQAEAGAEDDIAKTVIACAAEAYDVDETEITLATDIREDLSNQSMKMIVMLSGIEEALDVTIEIPEAGNMNTIGEFVDAVRKKMGVTFQPCEVQNAQVQTDAASSEVQQENDDNALDEIAKTVIACAAEAYEVEASDITLETDIREDLSNQSMKMIVMLSGIEEALDVTIEIPEAGNMNTIGEFVAKVREKM